MRQLVDFLLEEQKVEKENIVYINFEIDYLKYKDTSELNEYIKEIQTKTSGRIYLFFDEIQDLQGWEKLINAYRADVDFNCDIFITGSNANLLSSDLSTHLA
jgi:predicted AAA+ superfamily ATPase